MVKIDLVLVEMSKTTLNWFIFAINNYKFDHWQTTYKGIISFFLDGFKTSINMSKVSAVFSKY